MSAAANPTIDGAISGTAPPPSAGVVETPAAGTHKATVIPHPSAPALAAAADRAAAANVFVDRSRQRARKELAAKIVAPIFGLVAFLGVWALVAQMGSIPGPAKTWEAALLVFSDPFYQNGPNDQGIGYKIAGSLSRVGIGFGFAALVGIPLGFMIGRFGFLRNMAEPVIGLLRPVSPLAWLPIGLLVFKGAHPAAIWTIFISSIWPMIINTAVGVQRVPQDYLNVARVLNLSEWKVFTKILFPAVLPYMLTGVRLSMGVAWLVIVAAEMLTGGVGLGFWVWDEWNNLKVENILIAILVIGMIGLILEHALLLLAKRWQYD
jgi:nitrate/nitrite transport system permease protein